MLDPKIKRFLSNIGKKGGKKNAEKHNMKERGRLGGLKKAANRRKKMSYQERLLDDEKRLSTGKQPL